jgi:two-component system, chemotaxis family, sensor kinase CheA
MTFDDPELVAQFVTESREHLCDVEGQFLQIEAGGENVDVNLVNTVFRSVHSIKGAAGFLGLTTVNKLAHSLENVLGKMRTNDLVPTSYNVDVMLKASDALNKLFDDLESSNEVDVSEHVDVLDKIFNGECDECAAIVPQPKAKKKAPAAPAAAESIQSEAEPASAPATTPAPVASQQVEAAATATEQPADHAAGGHPAATTTTPQAENSIRVQVGVLDRLMNLAGELVLGRNQLMQSINANDKSGLDSVAARLDQVTTELQEAIMRTRMQPIGAVFSRFPRVARDLSGKLGKQCDIVMDGKEVEVDKTILEAIGDPLTHLVRNSIDHGVELPDVRTAGGKKAKGTVTLRAYHQAGKVRIDVADDGAGIEAARLRRKAVEKGVVTAEQASRLSDRETVRLIFHPGFSTAEKVTDVSGRGVGMDVVRTNIEKLGGTVDVESVPTKGTTIQITLPLTLAIIPSLIVGAGKECFVVPQVNVLELVRVRAGEVSEQITKVKDAEVVRLRGELLPIVRISDVLKLPKTEEVVTGPRPMSIVVIETGHRRYGLVVDKIVDSEEIVVKPLGRHIKGCTCLAGATILGDGNVALILDAAGIAAQANLATSQEQDDQQEIEDRSLNTTTNTDAQDLLLFSTTPQDRFAIPMSLVLRIERVQSNNIKVVGGRRLLQYRGSSLPLMRLEDHLKTRPMAEADRYYVIVFRASGREVGLLVAELDDIRQLALDIDPHTFRERGISGGFVLNETTMRLVDTVELAQMSNPEWFEKAVAPVYEEDEAAPLLLIAEDSSFFRQQLTKFFEDQGFDVVSSEDGQLAWDYLTTEEHDVCMVITDIEMPNMNGFELCRKIKQHETLGKLPVIALTSLTSEADVKRGREAGMDDYQVKLDREEIMRIVNRLLPQKPKKPRSRGRRPATENASQCVSV